MSSRRLKQVSHGLVLASVLLAMLVVPIGSTVAQPGATAAHPGVVRSVNGSTAAPSSSAAVTVSVNQTTVHARTGDLVNITSTVHNTGNASIGPATVYLTLMDVKTHAPLDLEDWAATRAHQIDSLDPGHSTTQNWSLKSIKGGTYRVYITVVPKNDASGTQRPAAVQRPVAVSPPVNIMLTQRNNLNPGNVLPTILGVPVGLLALAGAVITVRRRKLRPVDETDGPTPDRSGGSDR